MIDNDEAARAWIGQRPECDNVAWDKLILLSEMLIQENEKQNLVSRSSLPNIWQRHFADSAQLLTYVPRGTIPTWLDLGTGAGFPGLVIAIMLPGTQVALVESRTRRIAWLSRVAETLNLANVTVLGSRLEHVPTASYDVISARAFAPLASLITLSGRFSTKATTWLLPKGRSAAQELAELRGWNHSFHVEPSLTDSEAGIVVGTLAGRKG